MSWEISGSRRLIVALLLIAAIAGAGCKKRNECLPKILKQPAGVTIAKGESATLTVSAQVEGGNVAYKWYQADPKASIPLEGDSNTITVKPDKTTTYFVWVFSACGEKRGQQISDSAVVNVK